MGTPQKQGKIGSIGIGVCPLHEMPVMYTTVIDTGAQTVMTEGVETAIIGSIGIASCGHPTVAITGSDSVFHENKAAHRVSDTGINGGPYTLVTGSEIVITG